MGHNISRPRDIEMQSLDQDMSKFTNLPLHTTDRVARHSTTDPLGIGAEVFRAKVGQHRRSWRTILVLSVLLSLFLVATAVLGVLYGVRASEGPRVTTATATATATQSMMMTEMLTFWDTRTILVTSLQPTTETTTETATLIVTDIVTTTTQRRKTTSVTVLVTTSLFLTATPATVTVTATATTTMTDNTPGQVTTTTSISTVPSITTILVGSSDGGSNDGGSAGSRWVTTETRFTTVTAGDVLSHDRRRPFGGGG